MSCYLFIVLKKLCSEEKFKLYALCGTRKVNCKLRTELKKKFLTALLTEDEAIP